MLRQPGVLHHREDFEPGIGVDQAMDKTGCKPDHRTGAKRNFTKPGIGKCLNEPSSLDDQVGFGTCKMHVRAPASQSIRRQTVVYSEVGDGDPTRKSLCLPYCLSHIQDSG